MEQGKTNKTFTIFNLSPVLVKNKTKTESLKECMKRENIDWQTDLVWLPLTNWLSAAYLQSAQLWSSWGPIVWLILFQHVPAKQIIF